MLCDAMLFPGYWDGNGDGDAMRCGATRRGDAMRCDAERCDEAMRSDATLFAVFLVNWDGDEDEDADEDEDENDM